MKNLIVTSEQVQKIRLGELAIVTIKNESGVPVRWALKKINK